MEKIENDKAIEINANMFKQKTDSILFVIKSINSQGGIATQLMMAAVCIEVQKYVNFLQDITHTEDRDKRLTGINQTLSDIDMYIRSFKDVQHDLICSEEPKLREEELDIIKYLKERILEENELRGIHPDDCDNLDSWAGLQTDIPTLWRILYDSIKNVILELDSLYYITKAMNPTGMEIW